MKKFLISVVALAALGVAATPVYADDVKHSKADEQKSYMVKGEVAAIDKAGGRIRLKHEAIPALGWPAMTMPFPLADKSQLDTLAVGDQVEFQFVRTNGGAPLITQIKAVK